MWVICLVLPASRYGSWRTDRKKIVFSGDIGNIDQPLIKDPAYTEEADYVVMESTYGNRVHSAGRPDYVADLAKVLQETFDRGGNVVIPSFAVGRTQEMLYFSARSKKKRGLKDFLILRYMWTVRWPWKRRIFSRGM